MQCPHCGVEIDTAESLPGETVACPKCYGQFKIPDPSQRPPRPARSAAARATDIWLVALLVAAGGAIFTSPEGAEFSAAVWRVVWWASVPTGVYVLALLVTMVMAADR